MLMEASATPHLVEGLLVLNVRVGGLDGLHAAGGSDLVGVAGAAVRKPTVLSRELWSRERSLSTVSLQHRGHAWRPCPV